MRILIDTQVFIWLIDEDKRLGNKTKQLIYDASSQLNISYFSVFEMTIIASISKLNYDPTVLDDLPKMGIELLFPDAKTLHGYTIFNPDDKDPFDNALIATAINEGCLFITSDPKILAVTANGLKLLDATT
jgi:PIN domain nuclease of toxin-antitoxin system